MLFTESLRRLKDEEPIINDQTMKTVTSISFETIASYNISLSEQKLLAYNYYMRAGNASGYARLKIGTLYIGGEKCGVSSMKNAAGLFALPPGSYTIELQARTANSSYPIYIDRFRLGPICLSDVSLINLMSAGSANISLPKRKTCIGETKKGGLYIQAYNSTAPTVMVDGSSIPRSFFDEEKHVFSVPVTLDETHTVSVDAGCFSAVLSPWLPPATETEIVSLNCPQGSTIYVVFEPLLEDQTKYIYLGKKRIIPLGQDYYSSASGTGILTWSYTFDLISVEQVELLAKSVNHCGCITMIGVDVRA